MARLQLGVSPTREDDAITKEYADTDSAGPQLVTREVPTGNIDGTNAIFILAHTPEGGTETVYLNGLAQQSGAGDDYTISGPTITFSEPPLPSSTLFATYWFTA